MNIITKKLYPMYAPIFLRLLAVVEIEKRRTQFHLNLQYCNFTQIFAESAVLSFYFFFNLQSFALVVRFFGVILTESISKTDFYIFFITFLLIKSVLNKLCTFYFDKFETCFIIKHIVSGAWRFCLKFICFTDIHLQKIRSLCTVLMMEYFRFPTLSVLELFSLFSKSE
jgi:hypothetical protein